VVAEAGSSLMPWLCQSIMPGGGDEKELTMDIVVSLQPVVSLIAGILILIVPKLLNYIVAVYLIVIGILGLIR
jgi:hypothetical protein